MKITITRTDERSRQEPICVAATELEGNDWMLSTAAAIELTEAWQDEQDVDEFRGWYSGDRGDDPIVLSRCQPGIDHHILHHEWTSSTAWTPPSSTLDFGEPVEGFRLSEFPAGAHTASPVITTEETPA